MIKKPNGNSNLQTLDADIQEELWQRMNKEAAAASLNWLRQTLFERGDLGEVEATHFSSDSALSRWFAWYGKYRVLARSKGAVDLIKEWMARESPGMTPDELAEFGNGVFLALATRGGDVKAWNMAMLALARHRNSLVNQKRVELLETKITEANEVITEEPSQETKADKLRRIFGR